MKKFALLPVLLLTAVSASASEKEDKSGQVELRLGTVFTDRYDDGYRETQFSVGGKVAGYLGKKGFGRRLSAGVAFDYQPVSSDSFYFEELGEDARIRQHNLLVSPRLGVDVIQTSSFDLTVFGGGTWVVDWQDFSLRNYLGEWNNLCRYYQIDYCSSEHDFVGHYGAGFRYFPNEDFPFYLGVDYTRFTNRKNQVVGTVGIAF